MEFPSCTFLIFFLFFNLKCIKPAGSTNLKEINQNRNKRKIKKVN